MGLGGKTIENTAEFNQLTLSKQTCGVKALLYGGSRH